MAASDLLPFASSDLLLFAPSDLLPFASSNLLPFAPSDLLPSAEAPEVELEDAGVITSVEGLIQRNHRFQQSRPSGHRGQSGQVPGLRGKEEGVWGNWLKPN